MRRAVIRLAVLLTMVLLLFILLIGPGLLAAPITLLIGWWSSIARLLKVWHPGSSGIALFLLAVLVMVAGTHLFLRWVFASAHEPAEDRVPPEWRWKWTVCGFGLVTCSLLAICAMVLTTHQIYWISRSADSLFTDPFRERVRVLSFAVTLQKAADELQWNSLKTRAFVLQKSFTGSDVMTEAIQPVWIEKDEHSLRGIVLVPRRPMHRATARLTVLRPGTNYTTHRLEELPAVLASFGIGSARPSSNEPVSLLP
jgi:hypothetical protein